MINQGMRFDRLTALYSIRGLSRYTQWCCECDCGTCIVRATKNIVSGQIRSCGCLQKELLAERSITHGKYKSGAYLSWANMLRRCKDKTNHKYYGRGIVVCERWKVFANLYADMGDRPDGMTLDRINVDGNYEPGNCRWADRSQQNSNKTNSQITIYNGERITAAELAKRTGLSKSTVRRKVMVGLIYKDGAWVEGNAATA